MSALHAPTPGASIRSPTRDIELAALRSALMRYQRRGRMPLAKCTPWRAFDDAVND